VSGSGTQSTVGALDRVRAKVVPWTATVVAVERVAADLVAIRCARPSIAITAGDVLALRVGGVTAGPLGTWRRYTVASADPSTFTVVAHLAGGGPGSTLLGSCAADDRLTWRGPSRGIDLDSRRRWLVIGDESAIGAIDALVHGEVPPVASHIATGPDDAHEWLAQQLERQDVDALAVLGIGEHGLVREIGGTARSLGVTSVRTRVYWRPGRRGME
jgi:hypothetical protein